LGPCGMRSGFDGSENGEHGSLLSGLVGREESSMAVSLKTRSKMEDVRWDVDCGDDESGDMAEETVRVDWMDSRFGLQESDGSEAAVWASIVAADDGVVDLMREDQSRELRVLEDGVE
jgi:hypothetical protein